MDLQRQNAAPIMLQYIQMNFNLRVTDVARMKMKCGCDFSLRDQNTGWDLHLCTYIIYPRVTVEPE